MDIQLEDLQEAFAEKRYEDLRKYSEDFIDENPEDVNGYLYSGKAHLKLKDVRGCCPNRGKNCWLNQ